MFTRTFRAFAVAFGVIAPGAAVASHPALGAGQQMYAAGDAEGAFQQWQFAAAYGDADAQWLVGNMLLTGEGLEEPDPSLAVDYYQMAANQGHLEAMLSLATCYRTGQGVAVNYDVAVRLLYDVAEAGHGIAMLDLADIFNGEDETEELVTYSPEFAYSWYRLAARQGIVIAQIKVGQMLLEGIGTPEDKLLGMVWLAAARTQAQSKEELPLSRRAFPLDRVVETDENGRTLRQIAIDTYTDYAKRTPAAVVDEAELALTEWEPDRF